MSDDMLKLNILTIMVSGFLMLLTGAFLYIFRDEVAKNLRFFLPLPPIGVAAYIFTFNMFREYNGNLPGNLWDTIRELALGTVVVSVVFGAFIAANVMIAYILKSIL